MHVLFLLVKEYSDCQNAYSKGETSSGVYRLNPDGQSPFDVSDRTLFALLHRNDQHHTMM